MECASCGHENLEGARFCANCGGTLTRVDATNPLVGKTVGGRYKISRVLGEGGMGVVYEGEQLMGSTVRKVAVKTLHPELSRDPSVTARFHRECGTIAQLEHPNTIRVYDFGQMDDGTLYIAMEFLAGKSLDKVIQESGAMAPKRVSHLLQQVAGSLEEAHAKGIVHRDLKPENVILVDRAGEKDVVKLLDFGIAARTESASAEREAKLTQQGMVLGTPPYMSPEQFTGKALDRRSDIYSLGIMAYEMLTGRLPFEATTPWQWATEHMTAQPKPFEELPVSSAIPMNMRSAILKALSKDREQRFGTAHEFVDALSRTEEAPKVTAPLRAEEAYRATAAMDVAPNFAAAAAPGSTVAMPAAPPSPARTAATPISNNASGGAGINKLWLVAGGGLVLVAGGAAFALSGSDKAKKDDPPPIVFSAAAISAPTPVAASSAPLPEPEPTPEPEPESTLVGKSGSNSGSKPSAGSTKPATSAKTTPAPAAGGGDACGRCMAAAAAGDFVSLGSALKACADSDKKQACQQRARAGAGAKIHSAAAGGDCDGAKRLLAAAQSAGFGAGLERALGTCK